jgi:dihydroorotase
VTAAARTPNLFLDDGAVARLGTRAVTVPPLRPPRHREALWEALRAGVVEVVASGHRAVSPADKDRPYPQTPPGMPSVALTLPLLLHAVSEGRCTLPDVARWTGEGPARALRLPRKGRLEVGYDGDLALIDPSIVRTVEEAPGSWSPWRGQELRGWPVATVVLGEPAFRAGEVDWSVRGRPL